ncbi:MAG: hypothetical protein KGJ86_05370 [Chloroflexota bacterium]|nr:hypothetical protein [Chloroflexota bacterium]
MHLIAVDEASRVVVSAQFLSEDPRNTVWRSPLFRLQLRTNLDAGVILEFYEPRSLQLFVSAARGLLTAYRQTTTPPPAPTTPPPASCPRRPVARTFDGL